MKFNLSVFDIYSKTMVVESAVVDFKGLVAILGHLGGIRDITITDDYSVLKNTHGVSITSRRTVGPSYRFDISLVKDEQVEEASEPTIKTARTFQLSVTDNKRNCLMVARQAVDRDVVKFALHTFCGMDDSEVRNVIQNTTAIPHIPFEWDGQLGPEYPYKVIVIGRD